MKCINCEKETSNPKFCSKSCSAVYNNSKFPKRKTTRTCNIDGCDKKVFSYRSTLCRNHYYERNDRLDAKNKTLGFYKEKLSVSGKHKSWQFSHVRLLCRSWLKHLAKLPCHNCGYDKHVELCHIKPLSSFPDTALLSEVNSEKNVIQLCRNCHWEFDKGILKLDV
jgi:hypothetical protein